MGFFFLELLDDCDEESNNDDALASLDDAGRKLGSDSDTGFGHKHHNVSGLYCEIGNLTFTPQSYDPSVVVVELFLFALIWF